MKSGRFPRVAGLSLVLVLVAGLFLLGCGDSVTPVKMQAAPLQGASEVPANTSAAAQHDCSWASPAASS